MLLALAILAVLRETQGDSRSYFSIPVPIEKILEIGVASQNFSGENAFHCMLRATRSGIPYPTLCVHNTSGQCLLLNSTYPAWFNRTYTSSSDYKCYIREGYPHFDTVGELNKLVI
jgi:hypothetical protein